jgi:hypothetical protein
MTEMDQRRECMHALTAETETRHADWRAALEPEQGCTFEVYIQNPYIRPPEEEDAYKAQFKISRPASDPAGRCVRLDPLLPDQPGDKRQVFGDDEIYVANYAEKKPYDWEFPYYYPSAEAPFAKKFRPPSKRDIPKMTQLAQSLRDGCFHCMERPALWAEDVTEDGADAAPAMRPQLGAKPIPMQAPDFGVAMTYATARRALDIWKVYLDWENRFEKAVAQPFPWYFSPHRPRLEIVPTMLEKNLATSGFGHVQLGVAEPAEPSAPLEDAEALPQWNTTQCRLVYWINPDVVVHELGHQLLYAYLGFGPGLEAGVQAAPWRELWPPANWEGSRPPNGEAFRAFHEGFSDVVAIIVSMHHRAFLQQLLRETEGDIFSVNALTSIAEVNPQKTLRNTLNNKRVEDVTGGYYELSQVISGALFDVLAGFTMRYLTEYDQLSVNIVQEWERAFDPTRPVVKGAPSPERSLVDEIKLIYRSPEGPAVMESAVVRARDALGWLLGGYLAGKRAEGGFDPSSFTLPGLKRDLMETAATQKSATADALGGLTGALKRQIVEQCLRWRGM